MLNTREALTRCITEQDYRRVSDELYLNFVEKAKEEIIAYFSQGRFDEGYSALRFHYYLKHIEEAENAIKQRADLSEDKKKAILEFFLKSRRKCFDTIKTILLVAERMYSSPELDHDKAEALLNTPGTKIHRLARYTDLTEEDIRSGKVAKEADQKAINAVIKLLTVPEVYDKKWWSAASQAIDQLIKQLPVESLPILLQAVSKWSEREWTAFWTEEAILLVKGYIKIHGVNESNKTAIIQSMNEIFKKRGIKNFKEAVKYAQEVLNLIR